MTYMSWSLSITPALKKPLIWWQIPQELPKSAFGWSPALHTTFLKFLSVSCAQHKLAAKEEALFISAKLWQSQGPPGSCESTGALSKNRTIRQFTVTWLTVGFSCCRMFLLIKLSLLLITSPRLQHLQRWAKNIKSWSRQAQCRENTSFLPQFSSSLQNCSGKILAAILSSSTRSMGEEQHLSDFIYCAASFNKLLCGNLLRISALKFILSQIQNLSGLLAENVLTEAFKHQRSFEARSQQRDCSVCVL